MPLFYVKIRKNIDICNYLPIYYPAICRGWRTFSVPSKGRASNKGPIPAFPKGKEFLLAVFKAVREHSFLLVEMVRMGLIVSLPLLVWVRREANTSSGNSVGVAKAERPLPNPSPKGGRSTQPPQTQREWTPAPWGGPGRGF